MSWDIIGALIIRIGLGGILYYNYSRESPKPYSNYYRPIHDPSILLVLIAKQVSQKGEPIQHFEKFYAVDLEIEPVYTNL